MHRSSGVSRAFSTGYGVAILESGEWGNRRSLLLNYTSLVGHRQCDNLTIGLYARGLDLLRDLGYPEGWDHRWQWDSNSMAHNTVTVDETQPGFGRGGMGRLFASVDGVHVAVASHDPYPDGARLGREDAPPVNVYERTCILVDVDGERWYAMDLFAVNRRGTARPELARHAHRTRPA